MAEVKLNTLRAGGRQPIGAVRSSAYGAGFVAGENAAVARADLFRQEMAVVLLALGDAISVGAKADMIAWYGALSRVLASAAAE